MVTLKSKERKLMTKIANVTNLTSEQLVPTFDSFLSAYVQAKLEVIWGMRFQIYRLSPRQYTFLLEPGYDKPPQGKLVAEYQTVGTPDSGSCTAIFGPANH